MENIFRDLLIYLEASTVQMQPESQRALLITNDNIFYRQFGRHKAVLELLSKSAREAICHFDDKHEEKLNNVIFFYPCEVMYVSDLVSDFVQLYINDEGVWEEDAMHANV